MDRPILESKLIVPAEMVPLNALADFQATVMDKQTEQEINIQFFDYDSATNCYLFSRGNMPLIKKHFGHLNIEDRRVSVPMQSNSAQVGTGYGLQFKGSLRENQLGPAEFIIKGDGYGQLNAPPRFGKTITMVYVTCKLGFKTLFLSHQVDLSKQMLRTFHDYTNAIDLEYQLGRPVVGIVEEWSDMDKFDVAIMTYQKFVSGTDADEMLQKYKNHYGVVWIDECFDGRTLVTLADGSSVAIRKIANAVLNGERIMVNSYNASIGTWEPKRVTHAFKTRATEDWYRVELGNATKVLCTGSHNWFLDSYNKKQAQELCVGDLVMCEPSIAHKKPAKLGEWQKQLIFGGLFGDFGCSVTKNRARIKLVQGLKQKEYFEYKARILSSIIAQTPKHRIHGYSKVGTLALSTLSSVEIKSVYDLLKSDPKAVLRQMDDRAWAFLFMDNGSHHHSGARLHINRFPLEVASLVSTSFNDLYNATSYVADYKGSTMVVNSRDYANFCLKVGKYFHPSLHYKLGKTVPAEFCEGVDDSKQYGLEAVTNISRVPVSRKSSPHRYDLEVEDNHNYLVGSGYLVSNCHRASAARYSQVVSSFNPKYRHGVSGTTTRKDNMHVINDFVIGPVVVEGKAEQVPCEVKLVKTHIKVPIRSQGNRLFFTKMQTYLAEHGVRNQMVFDYIEAYAKAGHSIIAVTDRIGQIKELCDKLKAAGYKTEEYHAKAFKNKKHREDCLNRMRSGDSQIMIAYRSMTLGLDVPRMTAFFNLLPSANRPAYFQETSRVRTPFQGKDTAYVVDFIDDHYILEACAKTRMKVYADH